MVQSASAGRVARGPRAKPYRHAERDFHKAVFEYLQLALKDEVLFFHVPNGGLRNAAVAGQLKSMGVLPGVWDWCILWAFAGAPQVLWIELKVGYNVLSKKQAEFQRRGEQIGHHFATAFNIEEVEAALARFLVPRKSVKIT